METIGLGSNLLVHDAGVNALVLRLAGELAEARVEGTMLVAEAVRPTPSACTARATPASAVSSSPRRSPVRRAVAFA